MITLRWSCPLCGHAFDPAAHSGCASCPLSRGCRIICCPNCGHSSVDPSSSRLARWALGALDWVARSRPAPDRAAAASGPLPLSRGPRGRVRVVAVQDGRCDARERLRGYGIVAGVTLEVLQHRPAVVVRVEHTELALEDEVAAAVLVEARGSEV